MSYITQETCHFKLYLLSKYNYMRKMSQEPLLNEYIFNIFAFNTTFIGDVQYFFKKRGSMSGTKPLEGIKK